MTAILLTPAPGQYSADPEYNARFPHSEWVRLDEIELPGYQRPLDPKRVAKIAEKFDPARIRRPAIIRRKDDTLVCFDGQHTVLGMIAKGIEWGEVGVSEGIPRDEEGLLFARQHVDVVPPAPMHREYAAYDSYCNGSDEPEALRANALFTALRDAGWGYDRNHTKGMPNSSVRMTIGTTEGIKDVYRHYGEEGLVKTLRLIAEIWPNNSHATRPNFIRAMGHVANQYELSDEMKNTLHYYPLDMIEEKAKGLGGQADKSKKMAAYIIRGVLKDFHLRLRGYLRINGKRPQ